jgi:hypothetical protein
MGRDSHMHIRIFKRFVIHFRGIPDAGLWIAALRIDIKKRRNVYEKDRKK